LPIYAPHLSLVFVSTLPRNQTSSVKLWPSTHVAWIANTPLLEEEE
jgi:hypothetical protein